MSACGTCEVSLICLSQRSPWLYWCSKCGRRYMAYAEGTITLAGDCPPGTTFITVTFCGRCEPLRVYEDRYDLKHGLSR